MTEDRRWTPRQLRTFAVVVGCGLLGAVVLTVVLSAVTDLGAPRASFIGVLVAVIGMYAAIITIGIRERRTRAERG